MKLEVNGTPYTNFTAASCTLRLDSVANEFTFDAVAPGAQALPFKGGEACRVLVDDEPVLTGFIEIVAVTYDGSSHRITVQGRSKTGDLLDSTIDTMDDLRGEGLTLKALAEQVIAKLGLTFSVIDEVSPQPFTGTEDIAAPEPGDNAFEFIEKYARKRQVLLTSDGDGNLVITANSGIVADGAIQHIIGAPDNNVIQSSFSYDTTGRFNAYKMAGGLNPVALNLAGETDLASLVNQGGGVSDSEIRAGRQLVIVAEVPFSDGSCEDRARWELNVRRARGLAYAATVPGYRVGGDTGDLWKINRIYQVVDDFVGKVEPMLANMITFTFSIDSGSRTSISFVGRNAYTTFIAPDPYAQEADNVS